MGNSSPLQYAIIIQQPNLFAAVIVLFSLATFVLIAATYVRWKYRRLKEVECAFVLLGYLFYVGYEATLLKVMPIVYRLSSVKTGLTEKYPTILDDLETFIILMISTALMLWCLLWSIKFALLVLYRRLMLGLPLQLKFWMAVLVYTIISFVFCIVTTLTSCGGVVNLKKDVKGFCSRPIDNITRNLNFYGAFASDVSTDLLIMILPLRLVWGLQMSIRRKLAVGALFSVGIFCTITAIVRLVQIDLKTQDTQPNALWLTLWGSLEATTAIIVGCLPSFRFVRHTSRSTTDGYATTSRTGWASSRKLQPIQMQPYSFAGGRHVATVYGGSGVDTFSSRESLAPKNRVLVTTQHQVHSERIEAS